MQSMVLLMSIRANLQSVCHAPSSTTSHGIPVGTVCKLSKLTRRQAGVDVQVQCLLRRLQGSAAVLQ